MQRNHLVFQIIPLNNLILQKMSLLSMYCFDKSRARYLNSSVQQQYQMSSTCQNSVSSCLATIALKANKSYSRALCILTPSFPTDNLLLKKCSVLKYLPRKKPLSPRLLSVVQRQMFLPLRARLTIGHWSEYPKIKINYA